eukprot:Lithocolla_globosa_v1_NODE_1134_length_2844_cov_458.295805.p2 type:complete len:108 gc:universal NODE_1134_length_2844_cov_458.295805:585-262(-)
MIGGRRASTLSSVAESPRIPPLLASRKRGDGEDVRNRVRSWTPLDPKAVAGVAAAHKNLPPPCLPKARKPKQFMCPLNNKKKYVRQQHCTCHGLKCVDILQAKTPKK